jgi:hypothetical protein
MSKFRALPSVVSNRYEDAFNSFYKDIGNSYSSGETFDKRKDKLNSKPEAFGASEDPTENKNA